MIYLDNSATTRVCPEAVAAVVRHMEEDYYNPSAAYGPALLIEKGIRACREHLRRAAGAAGYRVVYVASGTEADNLAVLGVAEHRHNGANVVVSPFEHPAVMETIQRAEKLGYEIRVLPAGTDGRVDLEKACSMIDADTLLVSCMQVSNETGAIQPVTELARQLHQSNPRGLMHVDGVQGFLRVPVLLKNQGIDLYSISGHKFHAPKGIGALLAREDIRLVPQMTGGGQEENLRSSTLNVPGIFGLDAALSAMPQDAGERLRRLKLRLLADLTSLSDMRVNGPDPENETLSAPHIISLSIRGVRGEVMRNALEGMGVLVSTGSACASHKQKVSSTLRAMGLTTEEADGTIRISLSVYNTEEEMDEAADCIQRAAVMLRAYRRK